MQKLSEVLPDAIQIADRFHLYQNLLQAVKDAIGRILPEKIEVPILDESSNNTSTLLEGNKKNRSVRTTDNAK